MGLFLGFCELVLSNAANRYVSVVRMRADMLINAQSGSRVAVVWRDAKCPESTDAGFWSRCDILAWPKMYHDRFVML